MKGKVALRGRLGGVIVDTRATRGATVGVNLFWSDGSLVQASDFASAPAEAEDPNGAVSRTLWSLVAEIPVNVLAVAALSSDGFVRKAGDGWTASAIVNADLAGANTTGLAEGTNLYYTQARADARVAVGIAAHVALADPHTQYALEADLGTAAAADTTDFDAAGAASAAQAAAELYADGKVLDSIADSDTTHAPSRNAVFDALALKIDSSLIGVANGVAPLASDGKVDASYLPSATVGQVVYQTTWDASAGTAPSASPSKGWYYIVIVAGTTNLDGITDWSVGDWAIYDGTAWGKVDNTDAVSSVAGLVGPISTPSLKTALAYTAADVGAEPAITSGTTAQFWRGDKTFADLATAVRAVVLTGLSTLTSTAITATDTILVALGKLQAQISTNTTAIAGKQASDATLTALAAADWAANAIPIGTGANALTQTAFAANTFPARASTGNIAAKAITDAALALLDDADAATMRATLGVPDGTYTPTLTAIANVASTTTAGALQFMRVGNTVTVSGRINVTPTAGASTLTRVGITLPVASTFAASGNVGGAGAAGQAPFSPALIVGDTTNNRAEFQFYSSGTGNVACFFSFTYQVI